MTYDEKDLSVTLEPKHSCIAIANVLLIRLQELEQLSSLHLSHCLTHYLFHHY